MNEEVNRLAAELILELSKCTPEEYLQFDGRRKKTITA